MNIKSCIFCGSDKFDEGIIGETTYMSSLKIPFWKFKASFSNNQAKVCLECGFIYEKLNDKALSTLKNLHVQYNNKSKPEIKTG